MENKFVAWLIQQLQARGWTNSELARRADVVPSTISMVISEQKRPGFHLCVGIARAFGMQPEIILRKAGLLPSLPPAVIEEREAVAILRSLSDVTRGVVMQMLRNLDSTRPARALAETTPQYIAPTLDQEIAELVEMRPALGPLFDEARAELPEHAVRALVINAQIWFYEKEIQRNFNDLNNKLTRFLSAM